MHRHVGKRTPEDWQDAYLALEERYRQLQLSLQVKEDELRLVKVSQRRQRATAQGRASSDSGLSVSGTPQGPRAGKGGDVRQRRSGSAAVATPPARRGEPAARTATSDAADVAVTPVPTATAPTAQRSGQSVGAANASGAIPQSPPVPLLSSQPVACGGVTTALAPPDPSMVWGGEADAHRYLVSKELYATNEQLRQQLDDSLHRSRELEHHLARCREAIRTTQQQSDDALRQIHQLTRERDSAGVKLQHHVNLTRQLEDTIQKQYAEQEKMRFSLEAQIADLRSRLVLGAESNGHLSRDVSRLLGEVKERTLEVHSVRSKLALAEAAACTQRHNNESLLVELQNLNAQLVRERKRLLALVRDSQRAAGHGDTVSELRSQLQAMTEMKAALEREHLGLLSDFTGITENALAVARGSVKGECEDLQRSAHYWEGVAQMMFKDVEQRTSAHRQCREECEAAKIDRDEATVELMEARRRLELSEAKLLAVWPTHERDTRGMSAADVLTTLGGGQKAVFRPSHCAGQGNLVVELNSDAPLEEQVRDLQEANGALLLQLEQAQLANSLLSDRIASVSTACETARQEVVEAAAALKQREEAGYRVVERQVDRIKFLEAQVRSLRGHRVSPNLSLRDIKVDENVLEVFVGQLLSTETPQGIDLRNAFPLIFCTVDFLLHETVSTPVVTGLNAMLDTTVSFCISMDALLVHYLRTRRLAVQLHRVRSPDEAGAGGAESCDSTGIRHLGDGRMYEVIAEGSVDVWDLVSDPVQQGSRRPILRGHVPLLTTRGSTHIASLEFCITARAPLSESFKELVRSAVEGGGADLTLLLNESSVDGDAAGHSRGLGGAGVDPSMASTPLFGAAPGLPFDGTGPRGAITGGSTQTHSRRQSACGGVVARGGPLRSAALPVDTTVRQLLVDVQSVRLPHGVAPVPKLSCYFALNAVAKDAYLPANPTPRYEISFLQEGGAMGTAFPVSSAEVARALACESLVLFFFDETTDRTAAQYWAIAVCDLCRVLAVANQPPIVYELPLANPRGERVEGAAVTVSLRAVGHSASEGNTLVGDETPIPRRAPGAVLDHSSSLEQELLDFQLRSHEATPE